VYQLSNFNKKFKFKHFINNNMKKILIFLFLAGFILTGQSVNSQNIIKLGHINSSELFSIMPESQTAQTTLQRSAEQLQATLEELQVEFNRKYQEYLDLINAETTTSLVLTSKEEELQSLRTRIDNFQAQAEQSLSDEQNKLFQPIQDKALQAIQDVAAENGFTYIFDLAAGSIIFTAEETIDILPMVRQKLGIE